MVIDSSWASPGQFRGRNMQYFVLDYCGDSCLNLRSFFTMTYGKYSHLNKDFQNKIINI